MSCKQMLMQGDAVYLPFIIKVDGEYIDISEISKIEFVIGELIKVWTNDESSEVLYDADDYTFKVFLSEAETFTFEGPQDVQIRIKDNDGYIYGKRYGIINIMSSLSKETL